MDLAIGGHTHSLAAHWINGTATLESGHRGYHFSWLKACLSKNGGLDRVHSVIHTPIETCLDTWADGTCGEVELATEVASARFRGQPVTPSAQLQRALAPFIESARKSKRAPLPISLPTGLKRAPGQPIENGFPTGSLGDVVAEAMRQALKADVGVQNLGGVRADLAAGQPSFGAIYRVLPFGNHISVMTLTGAQLKAFIQHLLTRHGTPPHIAGLRIVRIQGLWEILHAGGSPLEPGRTYQVATNDYLAGGGEGLDRILRHIPKSNITSSDVVLLDALITYLQDLYPRKSPSVAPPSAPAPSNSEPKPTSTSPG